MIKKDEIRQFTHRQLYFVFSFQKWIFSTSVELQSVCACVRVKRPGNYFLFEDLNLHHKFNVENRKLSLKIISLRIYTYFEFGSGRRSQTRSTCKKAWKLVSV